MFIYISNTSTTQYKDSIDTDVCKFIFFFLSCIYGYNTSSICIAGVHIEVQKSSQTDLLLLIQYLGPNFVCIKPPMHQNEHWDKFTTETLVTVNEPNCLSQTHSDIFFPIPSFSLLSCIVLGGWKEGVLLTKADANPAALSLFSVFISTKIWSTMQV